jgi:hypothetical protein
MLAAGEKIIWNNLKEMSVLYNAFSYCDARFVKKLVYAPEYKSQ